MPGKLIALESTNIELLEKTARYLVLQLRSEGHAVEQFSFPQQGRDSAHFASAYEQGTYNGVNPYAACMFYTFDRYEAANKIKQLLEQNTIVVCAGYIGTTLAKLGAHISDSAARRGFYVWADSLETGTFGIPRADVSLVISEEIATLTELTELFPKDYTLVHDPLTVREALAHIKPKELDKPKKIETQHETSALAALKAGAQYTTTDKTYIPKGVQKNAKRLYTDGLAEIAALRKRAIEKVPAEQKELTSQLLTPLGTKVTTEFKVVPVKTSAKKTVFSALVDQHFGGTYGSAGEKTKLISAAPRNEVDALTAIVLLATNESHTDIAKTAAELPMQTKVRLIEAYLSDIKRKAAEPTALRAITACVGAQPSYAEINTMLHEIPEISVLLQQATPRLGYDIPAELTAATSEIEDCFDCSLSLYSQLEAINEPELAEHVVLQGNFAQSVITLNGISIVAIAKHAQDNRNKAIQEIHEALSDQFPLITKR